MYKKYKKILLWFFGITALISLANFLYTPYMSMRHTGELQFEWSSMLAFIVLLINFLLIQRGYYNSFFKLRKQ